MRRKSVLPALSLLLLLNQLALPSGGGGRKGALILSGGGGTSRASFGTGVVEQFVALAGGPEASFVFVPTASSGLKLDSGLIYTPPDTDEHAPNTAEFERALAEMFGVERITILHTRSRATANSDNFVARLKKANGVWLSGGNAGRLAATYLGTRTEKEIKAVFERGGVVGGSSAGAIILGSFVVRGVPGKPVLMARGHERGFGFLKNVAIYDDRRHGNRWYYWLDPGTVFDLRTRAVVTRKPPGQ